MVTELDGWYRRTTEDYIYLIQYKKDIRYTIIKYRKSTGVYSGYMLHPETKKHITYNDKTTVLALWRDEWINSLPLPNKIEI